MTIRFNRFPRYCTALACWVAGLWIAFATLLHAEVYRLQPGDTLRVHVIRLGDASWSSMVDADGFVRFPYIGRHMAAGKTLDEVQEDIVLAVVGQRISVFNDGSETVVVLDESSVFLDVAEYRPVTVVGAVSTPGQIDYRPGLTVRAAVGIAGGTRLVLEEDTRPDRIAALTARLAELQKTEAWLLLDLWHLQGQLDPEFASEPPSEYADLLETRLGASVIEDTRLRISDALRDKALRIEELSARIGLTESRISYLTRALGQYEVVSAAEEERLSSLLTLRDRGLVAATSVNDARAGALSASSRLLQTEADLSETRRELVTLTQERDTVDFDLRQDLLAEQARIKRAFDETRARLLGARQEIAALTGQPVSDLDGSPAAPEIFLHRRQAGTVTSMPARLDDSVLPGDVVEVFLDTASLSSP
jgi:polysaccharide export outer membrane protein